MLRALLVLLLLGCLIGVADAQPAPPAYIALSPPTTPPTLLGSGNPLPVVPSGVTPQGSGTGVSSAVLKASGGTFFGDQINSTASVWVFLFNATSLPVDGAVTWGNAAGNVVAAWQVQSGSTFSISEFPGLALSTGVTLGCSSTGPASLTASADVIA